MYSKTTTKNSKRIPKQNKFSPIALVADTHFCLWKPAYLVCPAKPFGSGGALEASEEDPYSVTLLMRLVFIEQPLVKPVDLLSIMLSLSSGTFCIYNFSLLNLFLT